MYLSQTHQAQSHTAAWKGMSGAWHPSAMAFLRVSLTTARLGMKKGDYNGWLLSYGRSASHRSNHFLSCGMLGKLGVALRGVSGCVSAHSGEFSSDNTVSGHTHTGRFGEIVDRRQNIALSPSRAYGLRGSNLCDICDKVLWLSITFNCRT